MAHCHDILVVDDRSLDAQETLIALEQVAPAASALHLEDGVETLQYLFSVGTFAGRPTGMPRLVLLNIEMSGMSGLCVLDVMRAHPLTRGVRVVVLSLEPNVRKHRHHDAFDADAYVTRPCDFPRYCAVLAGCVRHWLPSAHQHSDWPDVRAVSRVQVATHGFSFAEANFRLSHTLPLT